VRTLAILLGSWACVVSAAAPQPRIPFVEGLSSVRIGTSKVGDFETLRTVEQITERGYTLRTVGKAPADAGDFLTDVDSKRRVRANDQMSSRRLRYQWHSSDRETMTGNVPGISCALFQELRTRGEAAIEFMGDGVHVAVANLETKYLGTLRVVGRGPYPMIVNREKVELPVLYLRADLTAEGESARRKKLELDVVDDPDNPMTLRVEFGGYGGRMTSVQYPTDAATLERQLARSESLELSGIFFDFAKADLLPASDPMLARIAQVLTVHPDWRFHVDGHTDSVGDAAANETLSTRRAAAVRAALLARGVAERQLDARGFGEAHPRESNTSLEGRARNRRVELVRIEAPGAAKVAASAATSPAAAPSACRFTVKNPGDRP
jgi:outer membrane protein OmpA-like peptidoglycan-associated protein